MAASEGPLLLALAKEAFVRQVARRVRPLARSYVERWMGCEFWLYRSVVRDHAAELRTYGGIVLEVLRSTPVEELLRICRETRPDLDDLWATPQARAKLVRELEEAANAVQAL